MPEVCRKPLLEEEDVSQAAKVCGVRQCVGAFVILAAVTCAIVWSMHNHGYDTSQYNSVDNWRVGVARFLGTVLSLLYSQATLYNHLCFVDYEMFAKPCADPDSKETVQERWARTPSVCRAAAVSGGGWAVALGITIIGMTFFEPGCQRGLCITILIWMTWWQVVWYGAMLGRVDVDDEKKRPCKNWFMAETIQEIIICSIVAYFVFAREGQVVAPPAGESTMDTARLWFIRFNCTVLTLLYGAATLCKHQLFMKELAPALVIEGADLDEVWRKTPTAAKHATKSSGGWCVCFSLTMLSMTFLEPGCARGLCKCWFLVMIWWNCVWYTAMFNRIDFNDPIKRPWTNWFKGETITEIFLGSAAFYLGFVA